MSKIGGIAISFQFNPVIDFFLFKSIPGII